MLRPRFVVWIFSAGVIVLAAGAVSSQSYPNKPVRIVTTGIGGGNDFASRLMAEGLTGSLGQQVIVDNRAGGGGIIGVEIVTRAQPDGYTLLVVGTVAWLLPLFRDNLSYDPIRDLAPITAATRSPNILVVHPSFPSKSVKELIAVAKSKPGVLNYATSGTGNSNHVGAELFKAMAGVNMVEIRYKGATGALNDVITGEAHLMFATAASVAPHLKSGRLRALAVTSSQPSALLPGLPTVAASGLPGYESVTMSGVFAPAGTPALLIKKLNQEIVKVLNKADVKEKFFKVGVEVVGSSPEAFATTIRSEMARMGKVFKAAGIRAD